MAGDYEAWAPEAPAEQKAAIEAQLKKMQSSVGVIDEVLRWLEDSIATLGDVDSLDIDESTPDDQVKIALLLGKKMKQQFEYKAHEFMSTFDKYITKEESS